MYEIHQKRMKKRELKQKEKEAGIETEVPKASAAPAAVGVPRAIPQSSFMNDAIIKKS